MSAAITLIYFCLAFLSVPDIVPSLVPYRPMLVLALAASTASMLPLLTSPILRIVPQQFALAIAFIGVVCASWLPHGWVGGSSMALQHFLPAGIAYFLAVVNLRSITVLRIMRLLFVIITGYMLIMGIREHGYASITFVETPYVMAHQATEEGAASARLRGLGTLGDPNVYAQFLLMLIPLLYASRRENGTVFGKILASAIAAFFLYGVYLTESRSGLLGTVLIVLLYLWNRSKWLRILAPIAGIIGFVGIRLFTQRSISVEGGMDRLDIWSDGIGLFKSSPLWGHGYRSFTDEVGMTAHNSFLLCLVETGLIGYILWLSLLIVSIWQLRKAEQFISKRLADLKNRVPGAPPVDDVDIELRNWARAFAISLYTFLFTGFFLSQTYELQLYMLLGATGAVTTMIAERHNLPPLITDYRWAIWATGAAFASVLLVYVLVRMRSF